MSDIAQSSRQGFLASSPLAQAVIVTAIAIITFIVIYYAYFSVGQADYVNVITGIARGNVLMTIPQNPNNGDSLTLYHSRDRPGGVEFSYIFWIHPHSFPTGEALKTVFIKGTKFQGSDSPNAKNMMAPGVFLKSNSSMRVYMNTFNNPIEYIDVNNLAAGKWSHIVIQVTGNKLFIFVNGILERTLMLSGIPRVNFYDLKIGDGENGFSGDIADIIYYRRALTQTEIRELFKRPINTNYVSGSASEATANTQERSASLYQ
jgi:hypothetical protein